MSFAEILAIPLAAAHQQIEILRPDGKGILVSRSTTSPSPRASGRVVQFPFPPTHRDSLPTTRTLGTPSSPLCRHKALHNIHSTPSTDPDRPTDLRQTNSRRCCTFGGQDGTGARAAGWPRPQEGVGGGGAKGESGGGRAGAVGSRQAAPPTTAASSADGAPRPRPGSLRARPPAWRCVRTSAGGGGSRGVEDGRWGGGGERVPAGRCGRRHLPADSLP